MEILNTTPFRFALLPGRLNFPQHSLTLIVKGTFNLRNNEKIIPDSEQKYPTGDEVYPGNEELLAGIRYESDFAFIKPRADLTLIGKCYAPKGKYILSLPVIFRVGSYSKTLAVFGNRHWKRNALGLNMMSDPEPFKEMDLCYENSYGGPGFKANPVGKGYAKENQTDGKKIRNLPNIEDPGRLIDSPGSKPDPAGLGSLNNRWQLRQSKLGTYKGDYLTKRWPWFPEDFDYSYFNAAPADMQLESYLRGDEKLYFENLHPEYTQYHSYLPGLRVRCFVSKKIQPGSEETTFYEVPVNLDTLWVDMEAEKLVLVWRGWTDVLSEEYEEIQHFFIMSEDLEQKPQSKDQCHTLFLSALEENEAEWAEVMEEAEKQEPAKETPSPETELPESDLSPETGEPAMMSKSEITQYVEEKSSAIFSQFGISLASLPPEVQKKAKDLQQKFIDKLSEQDPAKLMAMENSENEAKIKEAMEKIGLDYDNLPVLSEKAKSERGRFLDEMGITNADAEEDEMLTKSWQILAAVMPTMGLDPENLDALVENASPYLDKVKKELRIEAHGKTKEGDEKQKTEDKMQSEQGEREETFGDDYLTDESNDSSTDDGSGDIDINQRLTEGKSLDGIDLSGHDFVGQDLTGVDFSGAILAGALLSGVNLEGAILTNADLKKSDLTGTNLAGANLAGADLSQANLEKANLEGADFTGSKLDEANLKNAQLSDAIFEKALLTIAVLDQVVAIGTILSGADLTGSSWQKSDLSTADLTNCKLHNTNFHGTNLTEASLEGAQGKNINFSEANLTKLRASEKCDFSDGNFTRCDCTESIWHEANLAGADFTYCKMVGADFSKCNLGKANLSGSDIKSGRFARANLSSAKMIMSNLFESSLEKADLTNADLSGSNMYAAEFLDAIIYNTKFNNTNLKMTKLTSKKE